MSNLQKIIFAGIISAFIGALLIQFTNLIALSQFFIIFGAVAVLMAPFWVDASKNM